MRRAPNWASSRPPLRTKCSRPRGDVARRWRNRSRTYSTMTSSVDRLSRRARLRRSL
ncbi:EspF repeat-containing protein [Streptomyces sp. NPDC101225]|uniref:EspF repeat-containing protein n=1 Tax=Streptomyces sp. NPDC101225 TaxID=3366135 RepID=UPI0038011975